MDFTESEITLRQSGYASHSSNSVYSSCFYANYSEFKVFCPLVGIEYIFLSAKLAYDIVFIQKGICLILWNKYNETRTLLFVYIKIFDNFQYTYFFFVW